MDSDPHAHWTTNFFWPEELELHLLSTHSDFTPNMTFSEHVWGLESVSLTWN